MPDEIEEFEYEVFTYTEEEAIRYPHEVRKVQVVPEHSYWAYTKIVDPSIRGEGNGEVLCYRTHHPVYEEYYYPLDSLMGEPAWEVRTGIASIIPGGLSRFHQVDCALTEFAIIPVEFDVDSVVLLQDAKYALEDYILYAIKDFPYVNIEIEVHVDQSTDGVANQLVSEQRAAAIEAYLIAAGHYPERIKVYSMGHSVPYHTCRYGRACSHRAKAFNNRVTWRVVANL